jgi:hypothetical protein
LKSRLRVTDHRRVMPITINTDKLYDTDLTDAAWALIAPMLPVARLVARRQNRANPGPSSVGQVGVVESSVHRTVSVDRISASSRQTSTFQTSSKASL